MDQAAKDRIQHEIEDQVRTLFPGAVRRVEWPSHRDDPHIEPGELLPSLILTDPRTAKRAARTRRGTQEIPEHPRPSSQAVPARAGTAVA